MQLAQSPHAWGILLISIGFHLLTARNFCEVATVVLQGLYTTRTSLSLKDSEARSVYMPAWGCEFYLWYHEDEWGLILYLSVSVVSRGKRSRVQSLCVWCVRSQSACGTVSSDAKLIQGFRNISAHTENRNQVAATISFRLKQNCHSCLYLAGWGSSGTPSRFILQNVEIRTDTPMLG